LLLFFVFLLFYSRFLLVLIPLRSALDFFAFGNGNLGERAPTEIVLASHAAGTMGQQTPYEQR
jgi:hypothetical protein